MGINLDYRGIIADINVLRQAAINFGCTDASLSQGVSGAADSRTLNLPTLNSKASTGCNTKPYCSEL